MKHLFLSTDYPPPFEGGAAVYIFNLVSNMPAADTLLITSPCPGQEAFDAAQPNRIWRGDDGWKACGKLSHGVYLVDWFRRFGSRLRAERVDIVHACGLFQSGMIAWILKRLRGVPYVVWVYAEELTGVLWGPKRIWSRLRGRIFAALLRDADGILGVSDFTLSLVEEFGVDISKAAKIVPMASEPRPVSPEAVRAVRARFGCGDETPLVLAVTRLLERKGIDQLLVAFGRVLAALPNARLLVAGRGPDEARLKTLAADLGIAGSVAFAGFVEAEEKGAMFAACDVFALPIRETEGGDSDGCPTVFLEASAYGKASLGGRAGGVSDAIVHEETGLIVDGRSPDQIAGGLLRLLTDRDLAARMGARARRRVLEELTPKAGAEQLMAYSRLILERRALA